MSTINDMAKKLAEQAAATAAKNAAAKEEAAKPAPLAPEAVDKALSELAASKGGGGNYKVSIVDLLKLFGMESSLAFRTTLAGKLGVNAGPHGSAEQNIALHKAMLKIFAENGGKIPDNIKA